MAQASICCPKGCIVGGLETFICASCCFETAPSTSIAIACMKEDCVKMEVAAVPRVVCDDEEIKIFAPQICHDRYYGVA